VTRAQAETIRTLFGMMRGLQRVAKKGGRDSGQRNVAHTVAMSLENVLNNYIVDVATPAERQKLMAKLKSARSELRNAKAK
jgi:histone H3/H4